ncbi:NAD-dependent epimerase/dehydratase family protein [Skermania piniformis]
MNAVERGVHTPKVVLVTGANRYLSGQLVARLAADPSIERVVAVDVTVPDKDRLRRMGRAEFVRVDIANPLISKVIRQFEVDTTVHAGVVQRPPKAGSRAAMRDVNVLGAMQLFAACQRAPSMRKVVLRSSSAVYGCSAKDPAKFTEQMSARRNPRGAYAVDLIEIEGLVRGLARRRPDIAATTLRLAPTIGPRRSSSLHQILGTRVVPTVAGRDARLQLLHEDDALAALSHATVAGRAGTFNVAGDGVLMLSQAIRRAGRVPAPMPFVLFRSIGRQLMSAGLRGFTDEQLDFFHYGCGLDTTRMRTLLGFHPQLTTAEAFDHYLSGSPRRPVIDPDWIDVARDRLLDLVGAETGAPR